MRVLALSLVAGCSHTTPFVRGPRSTPPVAPAAIDHRLLLIGDAGDANPDGETTLDLLEARVRLAPTRTTVVFLGDNVYETGMPDPSPLEGTAVDQVLDEVLLNLYQSRRNAERRLKMQVKAVRVRGAHAIFIPGNHDWDQFGVGGWKRILAQQTYLRELNAESEEGEVRMLPADGCPGPVTVDLGRRARLIVLDTQWWLELGSKPSLETPGGCAELTEADVAASLTRAIDAATAAGRRAIVVGHHPLASRGPHGGYGDPLIHLFPFLMLGKYVPVYVRWIPFPVLGTVGALWRSYASPNAQDFSGPGNRHMRDALEAAMAKAGSRDGDTPLVYAAGHDHSLQVFRSDDGPRWTLVSGLGSHSKATPVRHEAASLFAHSDAEHPGLMELDVLSDGGVRLAVVEWSKDVPTGTEVYSRNLTDLRARP